MLSNIKNFFKRKFRKMSKFQIVVFTIAFLLFALYAFSVIYAIGWSVVSSLRPRKELMNDPFGFPTTISFKNYVTAFSEMNVNGTNMIMLIINSIWYSVAGTAINIMCALTMAYVVSKYKFFGRNAIYFIAVVVMVLPIVGSLPATYKLIKTLHLNDSPLILLTFTSGFGYNFIVLYGFFASVSWSYAEAALMDGAGDFTIFFKVMLPQAMPAVLSLFILSFIGVWNDYQGPLLYMEKMPTLSVGIYLYQEETAANPHILYAAINLSILPVFALFIAFQETIMTNTVAGGLKG